MVVDNKKIMFILVSVFSLVISAFGVSSVVGGSGSLGISTGGNCYSYTSETTCEANSCEWEEDFGGSWCEDFSCWSADNNQTLCDALNKSVNGTVKNVQYNVTYTCAWEAFGTGLCDPEGGDFFGDECTDFTDQNECQGSWFCNWNTTSTMCEDDVDFSEGNVGNPSCGILNNNASQCTNVSGCSWDATNSVCNGHAADGISCSDINKSLEGTNKSFCSEVTFLSTCCAWSGSTCGVSFDSSCYKNVPSLTSGATFCEDTGAFKNKTVCDQLAGAPWYMPCAFNQSGKEECHFNSQAYSGGSSQFDELGSESACNAQGGVWKTQQFVSAGVEKTDSWCEFNFGSGGNCDSSCWACENSVGVTSLATAESVCESSSLGYCEFLQDGNANNGYGWCNPKQDFIEGGGKSCDDKCGACDFLFNPENSCQASFKGCVWVNDSNAPNGVGNCYGKSDKYCSNDCFSCYTSSDCTATGDGGSGACTWDNVSYLCKTTGFNGEICFDGKDNDNDGKVDCADSNCATDKFCGGADLSTTIGVDCPGVATNDSCTDAGCVWVADDYESNFGGEDAGHCDFPGAQCWNNDHDATACNATSGCTFINTAAGFCFENHTLTDNCFTQSNSSNCEATYGCGWTNDTFSNFGRCEAVMFSECFANTTRQANEAACIVNGTVNAISTQVCSWTNNSFSPNGGYCEPVCFGLSSADCTEARTNGLCEVVVGICEPDSFAGGCFNADGNETRCTLDFNQTCTWFNDTTVDNNVSNPSEADGWCDPKGDSGFINFMGDILPTTLGSDDTDSGLNDSWDITKVFIRDDFDRFVFGTQVKSNLDSSGTCNGVPNSVGDTGSGEFNHTFFWYMDTDGNTTNNCASRDNASETGYEFSFKYQSTFASSVTETKVSYRCIDGNWGATPIPLTTNQQKMCVLIKGGMAGIKKEEMFKFKSLFNKSKDFKIYATVGNESGNDSNVTDTAGPFYYSPGSIDFHFEDCSNVGGDSDGDGLTASNDPDCMDFLKFGYVPNEAGFECSDGKDNDGDGKTDCLDEGCSHTMECGGTGIPTQDSSDNKAPKVQWLQVNTFPDSAYIMYDTNEPANGTLSFYGTDLDCTTLNGSAIRDVGIFDSFVPEYKMWHDGPIDDFSTNPEGSSNYTLANGTSYYYKTTVCDVNNNCAVSACLNFTTKASFSSCKSCSTTFNFPYVPESGDTNTDPLGILNFTIIRSNGTESTLGANGAAGTKLNYSETKNFDLKIENKDSGESNWSIRLINASLVGKLKSNIANFSSGSDIHHNGTVNGTYVGLGAKKCQELINTFRPKKLHIGVPGNLSDLYQCDAGLTNCTQKNFGTNATNLGFNETTNVTIWEVPAEWGC